MGFLKTKVPANNRLSREIIDYSSVFLKNCSQLKIIDYPYTVDFTKMREPREMKILS